MRIILIIVFFYTISNAIELPKSIGTYGKLYEIVEIDWYKDLEEKFTKFHNDVNITQKLKKIVEKRMFTDIGLASCTENKMYEELLTIKYSKDVVFQGTVIYKSGQEVNILEKMPLDGYIVVMDIVSEEEFEMLYSIVSDNKVKLRVYVSKGNIREIQEKIKTKFPNRVNILIGAAQKIVLDRLKIRCVPTVAYQVGNKMKFNEIRVTDDEE